MSARGERTSGKPLQIVDPTCSGCTGPWPDDQGERDEDPGGGLVVREVLFDVSKSIISVTSGGRCNSNAPSLPRRSLLLERRGCACVGRSLKIERRGNSGRPKRKRKRRGKQCEKSRERESGGESAEARPWH